MTYFNTTNLEKKELKTRRFKAQGQRNVALNFFKQHPEVGISASEMWMNAFDVDSIPLHSIRRAITGLAKEGLIIKTSEKKIGLYGAPEFLWKYNIMPKTQILGELTDKEIQEFKRLWDEEMRKPVKLRNKK